MKDLGLDSRIILKRILKKQKGSELDLCGKGKDKWRGLVNIVTKFRVPYSEGNFFTSFRAINFGVES